MEMGLSASISNLQELKKLDISECQLTKLPEGLLSLHKLEKLDLSYNNMEMGLSASISNLQELKKLDISGCQLTKLPEGLWSLHKLVKLLLRDNRLCNYPTGSLSLPELRILDLSNGSWKAHRGNVIKKLPLELKDTPLTELRLDGNPIVRPPEAIWKQGLKAIKLYMTELNFGDKKWLRVDTINMIGESEAGKSSIAQSLVKGSPVAVAEDDRTQVMQRLKANLTSSSSDSPVYINDFGGHDIYRSIIPLFLPLSGLAILAYNLKPKDWKDQKKKLKQWLLTAIAKSTKIRLVIVGTRADLVESSEDCSKLKSEIQTFASSVLNNLRSDVQENIKQLTSSLFKTTDYLFRRQLSERLGALLSLERKLTDVSLSCATVSCSERFDDFPFFLELISDKVKLPEEIPARWWQVMQKILQFKTSGCPQRTMKEVQDIYRSVISSDPECKNLPVILRYMANSSQIMWIENHPILEKIIFHSPQGIVDICTKILDHRAAEKQLEQQDTERLSPEWQKATQNEKNNYKRGILLESLLKKLLPQYKQEIDAFVAFMEYFDLISEVELPEANKTKGDVPRERDTESIKGRTFVITSNLPEEKPKDLSAFVKNDDSQICSSIHVSLSFVGHIVPLSFFATSLSSILTVIKKHCPGPTASRQWKDGVWIKFANLLLKVEYHEEDKEVRFTARSTQSKSNPWFILYPVLKRLQENISASWPGGAPDWQIMCPGCAWRNGRVLSGTEISRRPISFTDFTSHSEEEPSGKNQVFEVQVFEDCCHEVPRSLCDLISQDPFTDEEQQKIATFYENLAKELEVENRTDETNLSKTSVKAETRDTPIVQLPETTQHTYEMKSKPHGLCLIINNLDTTNPFMIGDRPDSVLLRETFKKLGYLVTCEQNCKTAKIEELMKSVAGKYERAKENYDSFVCCVLARLTDNSVAGYDEGMVTLHKLTTDLKSCKSLEGKPKLFFIFGLPWNDQKYSPKADDTTPKTSRTKDFLVRYYLTYGKEELKNPGRLPIVKKFCEAFKRDYKRHELSMMLTLFDKDLGNSPPGTYEQIQQSEYCLDGKVFFEQQ